MKKILFTGLILTFLILGLLIGCSDDNECTTCPDTQEGVAIFYAGVYNGDLDCFGIVYGIDARFVDIDSAFIGTHELMYEQYFGEGMATYCTLDENSNIPASSGQNYTIKLYTAGGTSQGSISLLDNNLDKPVIAEWAMDYPYDSVAINTEIVVTWAEVAQADFYTIDWRYEYTDGTYHEIDSTFITDDTTITIPASILNYDGRIYFDIYSVKGPEFNDAGNLNGPIKGRIISSAYEYFRVYIGNGNPYAVGMELPDQEALIHKDIKDIIF